MTLKEEIRNILQFHLGPLGFEIVHYVNPLNVMDHMQDLDIDIFIFHTGDYPRHWKPFIKLLRDVKSKEAAVFLLVAGRDFEVEEAAKASYLGVNGIIGEDLTDKEQLYRLEQIFKRYKKVDDQRMFERIIPSDSDELNLLFTHPSRYKIVSGIVNEVSKQGISFKPNNPDLTSDLKVGQEIPLCSLRFGDDIVSVDCQLTRNRGELGLEFVTFGQGEHDKLIQYLEDHIKREMSEEYEKEKT